MKDENKMIGLYKMLNELSFQITKKNYLLKNQIVMCLAKCLEGQKGK